MSKALKAGAPYYLLLKATYYSKQGPIIPLRRHDLSCYAALYLSCYAALYLTEGTTSLVMLHCT